MMLKLGVVLLLAYTCAGDGAEETCSDYKLPGNFVPSGYDLKLYLSDVTAETYEGKVTITATTINKDGDYKTIVLNSKGLVFEKEHVTVTNNVVEAVNHNPKCETVEIVLKTALIKDTTVEIEIKFKANLRTDMYGLYKSTYKITDDAVETIIASQFQPTHARSAFPCFDEPAMKAKFTLQVDVPEEYETVLSNQEEKKTDCQTPFAGRGLKRVCFEETPEMSTYLLALVVSKFKRVEATGTTGTMGLYAPEHLANNLKEAAEKSKPILGKLEGITGVAYTNGGIEKLDQVAIPDFSAGAMENWGLVTYRESALLYDADHSTTRNKQRTSQIIAHEFSHMWFGNMLTTASWDTTWLNEGFARFFEYFGVDIKDEDNQFVVEQVQTALAADDVADASSLNEPASSPAEIKAKFNTISYNKGASIIRMLKMHLRKDNTGDSIFDAKLKKYLSTNIDKKTTTPGQLWAAFKDDEEEGNEVEDIFSKWADQPGYPVVTVSLSEGKKLKFEQKPFTYTTPLDDEKAELKWTIPITYWSVPNEQKSYKVTLRDNTVEIVSKENIEMVLVNPIQEGYYRVKYEGELLDKLSEVLHNETLRQAIPPITRAQIIDDAFNLARARMMSYGEAMGVISYLADEDNYYPWHAAFRGYSYLRRRITDEALRNYITRHMTELSEAVYNKTLKSEPSGDINIYRKVLVHQWMCELDVEECVNDAKAKFDKQIAETKPEDVKADYRSYVYCSVLRHSETLDNWEKLWERYLSNQNANEKVTILTALGCTTNKDQLNKYLDMSLEDKIRSQDANTVFNAVLTGNPVGVELAVAFLKAKHTDIKDKYGGLNALNNLVLSVADRIVSDSDRAELKAILENAETVAEMGLTEKIVKAAQDTLAANQAWINANQEGLTTYYKGLYGGAASMTAAAGLLVLVVLNLFV